MSLLKEIDIKKIGVFKKSIDRGIDTKRNEFNSILKERKHYESIESIKYSSSTTYLDALWGAGKTYFLEKLIEHDNFKNEGVLILDSWDIKNGGTFDSVLSMHLFEGEEEKVKEILIEKLKDFYIEEEDRKSFFAWKTKQVISSLDLKIHLGVTSLTLKGENIAKIFSGPEWKRKIDSKKKNVKEEIKERSIKEAYESVLLNFLREKFSKKNKYVFIDNLERLSSKDRQDIINTVLSWSRIPGISFIFLIDIHKVNMEKYTEENFWEKIANGQNYKLINDWENFIKEYELPNGEKISSDIFLTKIIKYSIESNFSKPEHKYDLRRIKTSLFQMSERIDSKDAKETIVTKIIKFFFDSNIGLSKFFYLENMIDKVNEENIFSSFGEDEPIESLIRNNQLSIQSHFYDVKIIKGEHTLKIHATEPKDSLLEEFNDFNNLRTGDAMSKMREKYLTLITSLRIKEKDAEEYEKLLDSEGELKYFSFKNVTKNKIKIYEKIMS